MACELKSKGIETSLYPLFTPQFLPIPLLKNPQAIIITSKNGIRALVQEISGHNKIVIATPPALLEGGLAMTIGARDSLEGKSYLDLKTLPLYTVGDKTAELAKQLGFLKVLSASGTSAELLKLIVETAHPHKGILWHLSGREVKGSIVESLRYAGFDAQREIVYEINDVIDLPASLCAELKDQKFSHVIFCSPRTTNIFVTLLKKLNLEKFSCQMSALCLSQEIGTKASRLNWKKLWISPRPNVNDLMRYFHEER